MNTSKIAIIGLGYVGLPLAVEFGKQRPVLGFDIDQVRIDELQKGYDRTLELSSDDLKMANQLEFSTQIAELKSASIYIVTVPTPIDKNNKPDLTPLIKASETLGAVLKNNDIVIYESTVYPGATEEECVPVLELVSGLKFNQDFFVGYSPERINPGDKLRRLPDIKKVTSGSTLATADTVDELYRSIIVAGTHKADSIKIAEGSKIIENIQRDVNIALINELFQIFERMNIDTNKVIEAAATKWNFMKLKPGLVGGHCIGVDPYYLLHKSQSYGYIPDLMRRAREINGGMADFVANQFLQKLIKAKINPIDLKILLLGFSFKEDCPDIRNTKSYELYQSLTGLGFLVDIYDPIVDTAAVFKEYGLHIKTTVSNNYKAALLAVGHKPILTSINEQELAFDFIYDFKSYLNQ
jgi:UDP-N-acetyl-D-galactosamine dehydrogenase